MSENLEQLQANLASAKNAAEKVDLLLTAAHELHRSAPADALKLAGRALRIARTKKDPVGIARSMVVDGVCRYYLGDYPKALCMLKEALPLTRDIGDDLTTIRVLHGLAAIYISNGAFVQALDCLHEGIERAMRGQTREFKLHVAYLHCSAGVAYLSLTDYPRALEHYFESLRTYEEVEHQPYSAAIGNIGAIYWRLGELEPAYTYLSQGLDLAMASGDKRSERSSLINLGLLMGEMSNGEESLSYFQHALDISRELGSRYEEAIILGNIGQIYLQREEHLTALEWQQQACTILEEIGDYRSCEAQIRLGECLFHLHRLDESLQQLQKGLTIAERTGNREMEARVYELMCKHYESVGDARQALAYHKLCTGIRQEVFGKEQQRTIARMEMRGEIERAEKEREIIRLEKLQLEQQMKQKQNELAAMALHLVEKNKFLGSLKKEMEDVAQSLDGAARPAVRGLMRQVDSNIHAENDWKAFEQQFEALHHGFIQHLAQRYPRLSRTELKICSLLKIQMSSKEIAHILATTVKNIEIHRYRIRKKLNMPPEQSFTDLFAAIRSSPPLASH